MYETQEDVAALQALLDASIQQAGPYLRASFDMPAHSLRAEQVVAYAVGRMTVALATTTAAGEPRVSPTDAFFYRGAFYIPTVARAAKAKHVESRPAVSLTHFVGADLAFIVHGAAHAVSMDDALFTTLETVYLQLGGSSVRSWGEGVYLDIHAATFYTYATYARSPTLIDPPK